MSRRAVALVLAALVLGVVLPAAPAGATPTVAIAGDSIGDESRGAVRNAVEPGHRIVWYVTRDAATIAKMAQALVDQVARPRGPDVVLVELGAGNAQWGTSDAEFRRQVRGLTTRLLRHATCVRWFEQKPGGNLAYPNINQRAARFNRILRQVVDAIPGAHTVHYETWTRLAGNRVFRGDLLHLNPRGQQGFARLARQAVVGCDPALTTGRFWDVADAHPAAEAIAWATDHRYLDGYRNGTFRADVGGIAPALDRRAWIRALWRRAGRPGGHPPAPWPDAGGPAAAPLAWAAAEEIVGLPPRARFRPTDPVSRADALRWLYVAEGRPPAWEHPPHGLTDVPRTLQAAVRWGKGVGVVRTPDGGQYRPHAALRRSHAAQFLHRLDGPPADAVGMAQSSSDG